MRTHDFGHPFAAFKSKVVAVIEDLRFTSNPLAEVQGFTRRVSPMDVALR